MAEAKKKPAAKEEAETKTNKTHHAVNDKSKDTTEQSRAETKSKAEPEIEKVEAVEQIEQNKSVQKKKRERPDKTAQLDPGDNTKFINHSLRLAELDKVDTSNNEQVSERCRTYFEICAEDDMKPSVQGLAVALGIDRTQLWRLRVGENGNSAEVRNTLKKAVSLLDLQMTDYMQNGKINPVSGIFLMKNNFGYVDKVEHVVKPELEQQTSAEELEKRANLLQDINE